MNEKSWLGREGATLEEVNGLSAATGNVLPTSYLSFLGHSNGGEGPLRDDPYWLVLDRATVVADASTFGEFFSELLVIGANGTGEGIALTSHRSRRQDRLLRHDQHRSDGEHPPTRRIVFGSIRPNRRA